MNKTCNNCKHCENKQVLATCKHIGVTVGDCPGEFCKHFETKAITKGDWIISHGNAGIAAFVCGVLNDRSENTFRKLLDHLNAPAESEGEDE